MRSLTVVTKYPASSSRQITALRSLDIDRQALLPYISVSESISELTQYGGEICYRTPSRELFIGGHDEDSDVELSKDCDFLLQADDKCVSVVTQTMGKTIKIFDLKADTEPYLADLGIYMRKFYALDAKKCARDLLICLAGVDITVDDEVFQGSGVLIFNVDENNCTYNCKFQSMSVRHQSKIVLRTDDALLWVSGGVKDLRSLDLKTMEVTTFGESSCEQRVKKCVFKFFDERLFMFAQVPVITPAKTYRQDICVLEYIEKFNAWNLLAESKNVYLESVSIIYRLRVPEEVDEEEVVGEEEVVEEEEAHEEEEGDVP